MALAALKKLSETDRRQLSQRIERQIVLATWGRIHRLKVSVDQDSILVTGHTASYYLKQLVLQGALHVAGDEFGSEIAFEIQVGKQSNVLQGDNDLWGVPRN